MTYTAIMKFDENNRVSKFKDGFETLQDAESHVSKYTKEYPNAFVVETPNDNFKDWLIDPINKFVSISPIPPTIDEVKQYAQKLILDIAPEWKQRNIIARSVELLSIGENNWTKEQQEEAAQANLIWYKIKNIRNKSNELENKNPIPNDFTDVTKYWS